MTYDEALASRIRLSLAGMSGVVEKKMFGGIAFMLQGNMACGVYGADLMIRVGSERSEVALAQPHTRLFDMSGRPMNGWILVAPAGLQTDQELKDWVLQGVDYALSLPKK
jgi:TfoX/Sxy family transcriptional regulator of competence genes